MAWNDTSDESVRFPAPPPMRADRFYVYVAWGNDRGRPLYVGKGNRPTIRIGLHLARAKWVDEVVEFECHAFSSSEEALEAEKCAIYELNPIYNVIRSQPRWVFEKNILEVMRSNEQEARNKASTRRRTRRAA
jgi:hypothetical protein